MKTWIGISLGIHVAAFGVCGTRPPPTRNLTLPADVYSVSLVSMPALRAAPEPQVPDIEKSVETVKDKPASKIETKVVDQEAIKPPSPTPKRKETPETQKPKPAEETRPEEPTEGEKSKEPDVSQKETDGKPVLETGDSDGGTAGTVVASALGQTNTQGTVSLDAANFGFSYYLVGLQAKVASNWFPPGSAGAPGEVLRATVHFKVTDDGTITGAKIETSSGVSYFDRCALRAILLSSPLAPLPAQFEEDELGVHFEFSHTVNVQ